MAEPGLRPCPAAALEAAFAAVWREQMQDMPMLNPALTVEAVGFRPWGAFWLGVLVTPWFMNLWLMPRDAASWQPVAEREKRRYRFPAGVFEFIGGRHAMLGDYQACSLFSPMFEFENSAAARATALAALEALMDGGQSTAMPAPPADSSKRQFLLGQPSGGERQP